MTYRVSVILETHDPEAITGLKELLATQAERHGDVRDVRVEELIPEQSRMEGFR